MNKQIESPFSNYELKEMFENQKIKKPFEVEKTVNFEKEKYTFSLKGRQLSEHYQDIWNDDYIIHFDSSVGNCGKGFAHNRFSNFEDFKEFIFDEFNLTEQTQMSLF